MLLVSGATRTVRRFVGHPHIGQLITPRSLARIGGPWGADNGAVQARGFEPLMFERMLDRMQPELGNCLFVCAPDVLGDPVATLESFSSWGERICRGGYPVAYVVQDGQDADAIPWSTLSALFIGGSYDWRLSQDVLRIIDQAKSRGLWVHIGAISGMKRIRQAYRAGVDSIDSTKWSRWPDTHIPPTIRFLESLHVQEGLGLWSA